MNPPTRPDTRLVRKVAAYLCHADAGWPAATTPHRVDPGYRALRRASGRRELLRNFQAVAFPARG